MTSLGVKLGYAISEGIATLEVAPFAKSCPDRIYDYKDNGTKLFSIIKKYPKSGKPYVQSNPEWSVSCVWPLDLHPSDLEYIVACHNEVQIRLRKQEEDLIRKPFYDLIDKVDKHKEKNYEL